MKKIITTLSLVLVLAAGCGSQAGATSTVTTPPKTITKTDTAQVSACQDSISLVLKATGQLLKATQLYESQIKPAYMAGATGGSIDRISANVSEGTAHVNAATAVMKQANASASICGSN
jgi:uncharacterized 2Fe-2S/4Fe-4S cluster protein (DUF4445 family)